MDECPLCGCKYDESDKNFKPCPCNYQVCSFCFNKLINDKDIDPLCPACRQPYNLKKIKFIAPVNPTPTKNVNKTIKKKKKKEKESAKKKEEILIKNRKELENVRVLQRNLVYITNIPLSLAKEEILKKHEYFGQYGSITKIVVNKGKYFNTTAPGGPSVSAYVTFDKKKLEDTYLCILAVDGCWLENRTLRASYGTTKYCSYFLKNITCTNSNCMYLHSLGRKEDSFTKEEMSQGKHLIDTTMNLDLNQIPKPTKPSVLPPPGVIAKDLPKEKRKKGYFDPTENEKKEISIKLPQQKQEGANPSDNKSSTEEVTEKMEFVKLTEDKDAESSTGEEEESDQDDSEHFQHSSEDIPILNNRGDDMSFSEKVKAKNSKKIHYSDISSRYKKSNQLPRRKPSGEVEEVHIPSTLISKPIRKHSDHNYEPVDFPRQDNSFFRRHSENGHEKGKSKNKFEGNVMNRNKYPPPHPSNMHRSRGSDGSIFGNLPSINEENEFLPFSTNIWSNEDNAHPRSKHNDEYILPKRVAPSFQEVEGDMRIPPYMMNPSFHYGYPLNPQYGSHYLGEGKNEDRGSFGQKLPNYPPNYGPNFQNPFYKQKSPSELYWGGYPPNGYMYPQQYPPNMGYPGGYPNYPNYPNYPPYHPGMYPQQELPHHPQNLPPQENVKENGGETSPNSVKKSTGVLPTPTSTEPSRLPSSSTPSIFPSHYTQPPSNQKHPNAPNNNNNNNTNQQQQQLPLFYTQRSSQDSFSDHPSLQPRNYPMFQNPMYQPNPNLPPHHLPQHTYPLFPPTHNPNYFSGSFLTSNFLPPNHPNSSSHPQHSSSLPHLLSHQEDDSHLTESILPPTYMSQTHNDESDKSSDNNNNNNNSINNLNNNSNNSNKEDTPKPSSDQDSSNTSHKNTNK